MELNLSQWYKFLAPRPAVIISTMNGNCDSNAAPFSFVMPVSVSPPLVSIASAPNHDTAKNILETKEFVVNIPGVELVDKLWVCSQKFPAGESEIKKANLTEEKSVKIKVPRIKECFAHFECRLFKYYEMGDHLLIVGEVLFADIKDELYKEKKFLIHKANPLMHIGGKEFGLLGEIVEAKNA